MKEDSLSNYLPVNRKFFDHPFWKEKRQYSKSEAWLDLIREARFDESEARELIGGKMVKWVRGELPVSLRFLADRWQWSKNKVDDFLKMLVDERMITKRTPEGTSQTIITLCNYVTYNGNKNKKGQQRGQSGDSEGTVGGQRGDKTNIDNIDKEGKECIPAAAANTYTEADKNGFENFKKWIAMAAPRVEQMKEPFTIEQYISIKTQYQSDSIRELLLQMHNWEPLLRKNRSAYLTILNWKRRDDRR